MRRLFVLLVLAPALAGCLGSDGDGPEGTDDLPDGYTWYDATATSTGFFARLATEDYGFQSVLMDDARAGGEPVIAVTEEGTILVATHPGWTHVHPGDDPTAMADLLTPANGQSYLWRSTDGGSTWTHVGLAGTENGPRSVGTGFSDPDLTIDGNGRIWYTDLGSLVYLTASYSDDDGVTWTAGNAIAGDSAGVDRPFLASYQDTVYLSAAYQAQSGYAVMTTPDDGLTWTTVGQSPCQGDPLVDPRDGALLMPCGLGLTVSTDGGVSWTEPVTAQGPPRSFAQEPAIDTAGGVFFVANGQPLTQNSPADVVVAYTPDRGSNWTVLDLWPLLNETFGGGTHVFGWVSAGSPGRAAVSWIASPKTGSPPTLTDAPWYVYTAFVTGMDTPTPRVDLVQVTPDPIHYGPMCQSGTTCQIQSIGVDPVAGTDSGDRRMGDFFETTIDAEGHLLMAFSDTQTVPQDVLSHPRFAAQVSGPTLLAEGTSWPAGWPTQG